MSGCGWWGAGVESWNASTWPEFCMAAGMRACTPILARVLLVRSVEYMTDGLSISSFGLITGENIF